MMKRVLVFLLAALLLCGVATATAETKRNTQRSIDAMEAIRKNYGENVFEGYTLWGPVEKGNSKSLIGVAQDGSLRCWTVYYGEDVLLPIIGHRELQAMENYPGLAQIAPRFTGEEADTMIVYDAHQGNLATGEPAEFFYTHDDLYGYRGWSIIRSEDGALMQVARYSYDYVRSLTEVQRELDYWLSYAFPDEGFKAADFEATLYDDGYYFTLKLPRTLDGHPAGTQLAVRFDREQAVTRVCFYEE